MDSMLVSWPDCVRSWGGDNLLTLTVAFGCCGLTINRHHLIPTTTSFTFNLSVDNDQDTMSLPAPTNGDHLSPQGSKQALQST